MNEHGEENGEAGGLWTSKGSKQTHASGGEGGGATYQGAVVVRSELRRVMGRMLCFPRRSESVLYTDPKSRK